MTTTQLPMAAQPEPTPAMLVRDFLKAHLKANPQLRRGPKLDVTLPPIFTCEHTFYTSGYGDLHHSESSPAKRVTKPDKPDDDDHLATAKGKRPKEDVNDAKPPEDTPTGSPPKRLKIAPTGADIIRNLRINTMSEDPTGQTLDLLRRCSGTLEHLTQSSPSSSGDHSSGRPSP